VCVAFNFQTARKSVPLLPRHTANNTVTSTSRYGNDIPQPKEGSYISTLSVFLSARLIKNC